MVASFYLLISTLAFTGVFAAPLINASQPVSEVARARVFGPSVDVDVLPVRRGKDAPSLTEILAELEGADAPAVPKPKPAGINKGPAMAGSE